MPGLKQYDNQADMAGQEAMAKDREIRPNDDPWIHRSKGMRCSTCMYFILKAPHPDLGRCRRHAPTMGGYPVVFRKDWCGDHKLDEDKL